MASAMSELGYSWHADSFVYKPDVNRPDFLITWPVEKYLRSGVQQLLYGQVTERVEIPCWSAGPLLDAFGNLVLDHSGHVTMTQTEYTLAYGGWSHTADECAQKMGYHGIIMAGLLAYHRYLHSVCPAGQCTDPQDQFANDNIPWNLRAAVSWLYDLQPIPAGAIWRKLDCEKQCTADISPVEGAGLPGSVWDIAPTSYPFVAARPPSHWGAPVASWLEFKILGEPLLGPYLIENLQLGFDATPSVNVSEVRERARTAYRYGAWNLGAALTGISAIMDDHLRTNGILINW